MYHSRMNCTQCYNPIPGKGKQFCSQKCHGINNIGKRSPNYQGGRLVHHGYVYILAKGHPNGDRDGYVLKHRLVMEEIMGRPLLKTKIVHHKNSIRGDNRAENLQLIDSQSAHMKEHGFGRIDYTKVKHPWLGRHHSEEQKKRWSKMRKGKKPAKGAKIAPATTSENQT